MSVLVLGILRFLVRALVVAGNCAARSGNNGPCRTRPTPTGSFDHYLCRDVSSETVGTRGRIGMRNDEGTDTGHIDARVDSTFAEPNRLPKAESPSKLRKFHSEDSFVSLQELAAGG